MPIENADDYSSLILVKDFYSRKSHNFVEYIAGGLEMQLMIAIDFTGSNGNPRHSNSLHYLDPNGLYNSYEKALHTVAEILLSYDSD